LYDFKQLSPADFEDLTRDLLQKHWKVRLEAFKNGRDTGIDLRYAALPGRSLIVQCKHFVGSNLTKLLRELRTNEMPKVVRLAPDRYVLATSLPLNPADKDKIRMTMSPYIRATGDVFGADDLNNLLRLHSEIETQHFKLWLSSTDVLERVLNNAAKVQTDFNVDRIRRAIPLYVQTNSYSRALDILDKQKFVIISGVPGIGKTTLAEILLFAHLESGYKPVVIGSDLRDARTLFRKEAQQIFYFDDFLGDTFLGNRFDFLGKKEDAVLLEFMDMVRESKHARLILTAREHILRYAFQISERFQRRVGALSDHRCILELSDYTLVVRGRILYNHIYFSDLPFLFKNELLKNEFYFHILKHRNFNPRLVEWLSKYTNLKTLSPSSYQSEVKRVLDNPEQLWQIAFEQQISEASRSVLLALYSLGGTAHLHELEEVWGELHQSRAQRHNWKTAAEEWRQSLQELESSFLTFENREASFVNPSVKDFLDSKLVSDSEHLDDLLYAACKFDQIVHVWALATSEKGLGLQAHLGKSSKQLRCAINSNLSKPYEEISGPGSGSHVHVSRIIDARPEVRLRTLLSISEHSKAMVDWEMIVSYAQEIVRFWHEESPDCATAVHILEMLAQSADDRSLKLALHDLLKSSLLKALLHRESSSSLATIVEFARGNGTRWTKLDQDMLAEAFEKYLENEFHDELAESDTEEELRELSTHLDSIADLCGAHIGFLQDEIDERIAELENPDEDDSEPVRSWKDAERPMSESLQEAEVRRLFDGLGKSIRL
jgi:hypothetical protein